ncbi:MAG: hypothetical protein ACKER6_00965 [Candidatus Hodgkinia cicadicola]
MCQSASSRGHKTNQNGSEVKTHVRSMLTCFGTWGCLAPIEVWGSRRWLPCMIGRSEMRPRALRPQTIINGFGPDNAVLFEYHETKGRSKLKDN